MPLDRSARPQFEKSNGSYQGLFDGLYHQAILKQNVKFFFYYNSVVALDDDGKTVDLTVFNTF